MSVQSKKTTTTTSTYRTVNVASPEPVSGGTVLTATPRPASPLQYAVNGNYSTLRYLVPVQPTMQQQSYVLVQQPAVVPQMMSPVYLQGVPSMSVSSLDSEVLFQQNTSVRRNSSSGFSLSSGATKSPEPSVEEEEDEEDEEEDDEEEEQDDEEAVEVEEVEVVNVIQQKPPPAIEKISRTEVKTDLSEATKMDTRYFAALLADVYRKNCDIHSCISEHVSKIRGHKVDLGIEEGEDVEALLPKGATELTKQQIRYLLQTRLTADKSMRLLLSTFSSLREELLHMSEDLRRLESEKESLERDLAFKVDQAHQYDSLLEAVRENNRQLQVSLKESTASQRSLESQLMSARNTDSSRDFQIRDLEGRIRALEKENEMLRQKHINQSSSTTLHIKTEELSRQFNEQLLTMKKDKDQEIQRLRTQITRLQTEITTERSSSASEKTLQLKISELLAMLEQRQTTITRQEEEIRRLMMDRNDSSKTTKTIITKRYRNQYPILGLLSDDYQVTSSSPISEDKTIVIERSGEIIRRE
ncbi:protein POF1B isoform X1 [Syngnathoides biaculeatus]|uniref:protein POF1B isoform X1 n=1 Tax=Syngnathoides biaculeatus TaxID=300417 RepID=UPI002ADE8EED|nr:protein POF1B isoform X1 [Syngnathoides biaculeatus]